MKEIDMAKKIYKWEVSTAGTGPYASFKHRAWPSAYDVENESIIASIRCEDEYNLRRAKAGNHKPLQLSIADYSEGGPGTGAFKWKTFKKEFAALEDVKAYLDVVIENKPQILKRNNLIQESGKQENIETSSSPGL
jgi:hypothetical protein